MIFQSVAERSPNEVRTERSEAILSKRCHALPVFTRVEGELLAEKKWHSRPKIGRNFVVIEVTNMKFSTYMGIVMPRKNILKK